MFEQEIDRIRKKLKQLLATQQQYTPLQAIQDDARVHDAYRKFFRAEVAWWIHEERSIRTSNPRFDIQDPRFAQLLASVDEQSTQAARFDHEELTATIDSAVKTRLNMLCRPRTTLKWFVFRGEPTKPIREVLLRLDYLSDYPYIMEGFVAWSRARRTDASQFEILSVVEFERIIEKIDNEAILDLSQNEFVAMLDPMFEFFADANPELPPETVPTEAVIIFLDDKGAIPISQALERLLYREQMAFLTRTKLVDIINDVIKQIDDDGDGGSQHDPIVLDTMVVPPASEAAPVPAPIVVQLQQVVQPAITTVLPEEAPLEEAPLQEQVQNQQIQAVHREVQLDEGQKRKMIKKLFDDDEIAFGHMIGTVLEQATWKEAAAVLDRLFAKRGIEPNGTLAMELAQALHRAYL